MSRLGGAGRRLGVAPLAYQVFAALVRRGMVADGRMDPGDVVALDVKPVVFSP